MRLIFLDVDGVLNQLQKYFVDNKCVQRLSSLIDFDVKIVLISSWRLGLGIDYKKCSPQVQKLCDICKQYDFDIIKILISYNTSLNTFYITIIHLTSTFIVYDQIMISML